MQGRAVSGVEALPEGCDCFFSRKSLACMEDVAWAPNTMLSGSADNAWCRDMRCQHIGNILGAVGAAVRCVGIDIDF